MSYGAIPEPFGIELDFDSEGVKVTHTDLPDSFIDSKLEKALTHHAKPS